MIVDSSALLAILLREEDAPRYVEALLAGGAEAGPPRIAAANWVEAAMVAEGRGGPRAGRALDALMAEADVEVVPVTAETARLAREAWRVWGKGNHPAKLNLGDCFAYALAQERSEPLLYKGDDFARTDVRSALDAPGPG